MATKLEICNMALSHIHAERIDSLNENTNIAEKVNLFYNTALETVLRDFPWGFATKEIPLALTPDFSPQWRYVYAYPVDCVHMRRVLPKEIVCNNLSEKYSIMFIGNNKRVCSNLADAYGEYTSKNIQPEEYDPQFTAAFAWRLAADLAMSLTARTDLIQMATSAYDNLINRAKTQSAREGLEETPYSANSYLQPFKTCYDRR